jgi:L-aspartate oxidase
MNAVFDDRRYLIPFRAMLLPQIFTDVLVIGSGAAGYRAALAAATHSDVIIAGKADLHESNTRYAQGGIAAVMPPLPGSNGVPDSCDAHVTDTLKAGAGLCDEAMVRSTVDAAAMRIDELLDWGMRFDRTADGEALAKGREGGHCQFRVLHADGDATGAELIATLSRCVESNESIRLFDHCFVLDLITVDGGSPRCVGAITHHKRYGLQVIWAKAVVVATGGCGQLYRESTNPPVATGDGLAMAYRAGAELADMAFVQFHPTTLYIAGASRALITEAVRGEGAYLIDRNGHRFMPEYHQDADLAPRDVVSRSILTQLSKTNYTHVFLDCRHFDAGHFERRFPGISAMLKQFEIDPSRDAIPIHPSAHYMIGGIATDDCGRTSVAGLYACGEAACTGLHGANRLASNSLLEALVLGAATGEVCREMHDVEASRVGGPPPRIVSDIPKSDRSELDLDDVHSSLRSVMWRHVGIQRHGARLAEVVEMCDFWARYTLDKIFDDRGGWQVQNMLLVGALITRAALWRCESRGTHYRVDIPDPVETYKLHDRWQRGEDQPRTSEVMGRRHEGRIPEEAT